MKLRFGSVCSGIEAASVAWNGLGWDPAWFSEIEPFPSAVLAHHYPEVPNLGDMTRLPRMILEGAIEAPEIFTGGTPCQAFSVAGLRESLGDARGNLTIRFVEISDAIDFVRERAGLPPAVIVWENVPGVLSTHDNAFGCFLAGLAGEDDELQPPGRRWSNAGAVYGPARTVAWRTLDAQYFGLAQRRRRVFVVASAREGFDPSSILFEWDGRRRDHPPRREARKDATVGTLAGTSSGGGWRVGPDEAAAGQCIPSTGDVSHCLNAGGMGRQDYESETLVVMVAPTLRAGGNRTGGDRPPGTDVDTCESLIPCHTFDARQSNVLQYGDRTGPLDTDGHSIGVLAFDPTQVTSATNRSNPRPGDPCHTLTKGAHAPMVAAPMSVRRLTPRECERLQGFPDDYTDIPYRGKPAADGPRCKALGNSWAVPVVRWIGARIDAELDGAQE